MTLTFKQYHHKRNEAFEFLSNLKDKAKQVLGLQDEKGKTGLDKHLAVQTAKAGGETAAGLGGVATNALKTAGHIATGNVVGAAFSIWDWIKSVAGAGAGLKSFGSAGALVYKVKQHKAGLTKFLTNQGIPAASVTKIVDAIFEIDVESVEEIPPTVWGVTTAEFTKLLDSGYDDIDKKVFASVVHQQLLVWLKKYAGHAEGLEDAVRNLLKERQEKIAVLVSPKVKELVAQYRPTSSGAPDDDILKTRDDPNDHLPEPWASSANQKPNEGDKAYTKYHGETYVGKLQKIPGYNAFFVLPDGEKARYHDHGGVHVGYDEPIKWDKEKGMWYAPADYD